MQQQTINIPIEDTTPVLCEECSNTYFEQAVLLRKVSALLSGTGQTSYLPIPVFACNKCGHVNEEFKPREIKSL